MRAVWGKIAKIAKVALIVVALGIMLFTIISVTTFDQQDRSLFGYKLFIVLSDSMRATDFEAGDLILVEKVDTKSLKPGDIVSYVSTNPDNYGKTVTHKIREIRRDDNGNLGFITYGTTTGVNDDGVVTEGNILGIYRMRFPKVGKFFSFLKTTPGYILLVLLPFLAAIIYYGASSIRQFREYREDELAEIKQEREKLQQERLSLLQLYEKNQKGVDDTNEE